MTRTLLTTLFAACLAITPGAFAVEIMARAYDAIPDSGKDAAPGIQKAIDAARQMGPGTEVVLEKGRYLLDSAQKQGSILNIAHADGVTLRGVGVETELVVINPRLGCISVMGSTNVVLRGFCVDYDPVPFAQGDVKAVNQAAGEFDVALHACSPSLAEPWFADADVPYGKWGMIFDKEKPLLKKDAGDNIFLESWTRIEGDVWRVKVAPGAEGNLSDMVPGDRFVHLARRGSGNGVMFFNSKRCTVEDVAIYAAPGLASGAVASEDITFRGIHVAIRPGTERLLSTNADGCHCQQMIKGLVIENCVFESMADDAINIYYPPNVVVAAVSPTELDYTGGGAIKEGDELQIFEPQEGILRGVAKVLAIAPSPDGAPGWFRITFDKPVEGVHAGTDSKNADTIYNASRCGAGSIIRNNVMRNHRRYAVMMKAPGAVIEGNSIEGIGGPAIVLGNDPHWPEGAIPSDVVIRRNAITDIGRTKWYFPSPIGAAIQVHTLAFKGVARDRAVSRVVIEANALSGIPGAAIFVGAATDVSISANVIQYPASTRMARETGAIVLDNVTGAVVKANAISSDKDEVTCGVEIRASVPQDGVVLEANTCTLRDGKPAIMVIESPS